MNIEINQNTIDSITDQLSKGAIDIVKAGYLTGSVKDDTIFVDGVYVPQQSGNNFQSTITAKSQSSALQTIYLKGKEVVGLAQYNGLAPAFESAVFRDYKERLSDLVDSESIGFIVNSKREYTIIK